MTIAMIFDGLQTGGIESVGADYVKLLQQLGHHVTVINLCLSLNDMEEEYSSAHDLIHINYHRKLAPEQCAQEEALSYNKNSDLNIRKLYNPTFINSKNTDADFIAALKEKYGKFLVMVSQFQYPHKDHFSVAEVLKICRDI